MSVDPVAVAAEHFGVVGTATALPGYLDENHKIETADGSRYVLKISASVSPLQDEMLKAIADRTPYQTSGLVGSTNLEDGRSARLLTWVDGMAFADAGRPPSLARAIGVAAGEVANALAPLEGGAPAGISTWDLASGVETIRSMAPAIDDERRRTIVLDAADLLDTLDFAALPHQVIHNDLSDDNVLVAGGAVAGVIDVADAVWSARIAEAAVAATYVMHHQEDPLSVACDLVGGFASVVDVTTDEAAAIWPLIMARMAISVVHSASGPRDNIHRTKSEAGGWDILERFHAGDSTMMRTELSTAAGHPVTSTETTSVLERRHRLLGPPLSLAYEEPINVVRGSGVHLYDERGRRYLDCVNNVAHVGHSNPTVVAAASLQAAVLNINTRYLHDEVLRYAGRITATMPDGLDVVFLTNSGSEANELAIRLVRAATGNYDVACLEGGYHGNTTTLVEIGPYKFAPGKVPEPWVHVLPSPSLGTGYDEAARRVLAGVPALAGLIAESIQGSAGQIVPASGVLASAYESVRRRGGLAIADEVQTGLGRVGSAFWSFELHGVVPDVVTLGKPMGNGHPVGAVVTSRQIGEALGGEYFNTFGGNPVSAAVANAVLDVIEDEALQANAAKVGSYLMAELETLAGRRLQITDVRGAGLFVGVELASADVAGALVEHAKANGVLITAAGNVLKIKPPLVFSEQDADRVVAAIDAGLAS